MTTDAVLRSFAAFLAAGWAEMSQLLEETDPFEELLADWMQANWETLAEAVLFPGGSGFLEVYGNGADCNGASSRVFRPEVQPTHRIRCLPRRGELLRDLGTGRQAPPSEMTFWGFVHWDSITYDPQPPFNAVLLEGKEDMVIGLDDVHFALEEI